MRELTSDALVRLTAIALERTAFLMAESADPPSGSDLPGRLSEPLPAATCFARIDYRGPERGEVFLAASDGFARKLAAGLLGADPDSPDAEGAGPDALRELANIVGGSLICELGGERCPFSIGLPAVCDAAALPTNPTAVATLDVEGERLEVHWSRLAIAQAA
jgi:CheY-specific phosphatase CheX